MLEIVQLSGLDRSTVDGDGYKTSARPPEKGEAAQVCVVLAGMRGTTKISSSTLSTRRFFEQQWESKK
jgi:hypothetical protein